MSKDWTGGFNSVFKTLGASIHGLGERESDDYYATHPMALEIFAPHFPIHHKVWEPSCGEGHLSKWLAAHGHDVLSTDLVNRGYGIGGMDFFKIDRNSQLLKGWSEGETFDILTNPPYKYATEFVLHALDVIPEDGHVIMFLKTTFLEGKIRKERIFDNTPPIYVYQYSGRMVCAKNGDFKSMEKAGSAVAYAMYVWSKSNKEKRTEIKWI